MARRETSVRLTYADYVHFPDDKRYEIIDGEAFLVPSPNRKHQRIAGTLHGFVWSHLREHRVGEVYIAPFDVILTESDIVQPDVVYIAADDLDVLTHANVRGSPTWVVEVLSPSTRKRDLTLKRQAFERTGVAEVWFVDPENETVSVLLRRPDGYEELEPVRPPERIRPVSLPSLELDLTEVFADSYLGKH